MSIEFPVLPAIPALPSLSTVLAQIPGIPNVSTLPSIAAGLPAVRSFPGVASIVSSISGQVLSVSSGFGAISAGLAITGAGVLPGTVLTSGLQAITNGIGVASINLPQTVGNIAMQLTGSFGDLADAATEVLEGDTESATGGAGLSQWGIYLRSDAVLVPDSIVALELKKDWHIADYPIEKGGFESYNKVRIPFETKVTMTKGGTEAERADFLDALEKVAQSLDLYDVVTPDKTYTNANVTHFDYRRTSDKGVSLLTVAVWLQEVRLQAATTFTQTAQPGAANEINVGTVQSVAISAIPGAAAAISTVTGVGKAVSGGLPGIAGYVLGGASGSW